MSDSNKRKVAWAMLSRMASGPCAPLLALVDKVGVEETAAAMAEDPMLAGTRRGSQSTAAFDRAVSDLEEVERLGGRLVTPDDAEWPVESLACLFMDSDEPALVRPLALWVRGSCSLREATAHAIAVVGARACSSYGEHVTGEFVNDLVRQGWSATSGAAFGIDAAAHRAAMAGRGLTVAVMACGVDRVFPPDHQRLLEQIAERGLIVSEYPPGARVGRQSLLERNRLIAALSRAVIVIEAGMRSGSAPTVTWARRMGRPVFAVPGPITSATSRGCHHFIAGGEAQLATSAHEVIQALTTQDPTAAAASTGIGLLGPDGVIC
ncbi:DNA processing protein [Nocardia tenerifensis]|uniref:DNA processing protein n=1 Tax=Nocardia tenerifensis TaxID=228006 RepID=A0A318JKU4_9NOCA|nr:DNA-processing protein DprA [Nocardia tenerifensis]PXX53423.1 DNA processing protein [Nocardia tenerifensis]